MSARCLAVTLLVLACSFAHGQEPATILPAPPVRLGPPVPTRPNGELPPLLVVPEPAPAPRKACRSCANDYHPSHVYLPEANPDFGAGSCDGECHECRRFWTNLSFLCGLGDELLIADRKPMLGFQGEFGYWLDDQREFGLQLGLLTAHASFNEMQPGGWSFDAPATLTALNASARAELFSIERIRVAGLFGYQFVQLHEKATAGTPTVIFDEMARNQVNGARVGLVANYRYGVYLTEAYAAVTAGRNGTTVRVNGVETTDTAMCWVPEFGFRLGYQLGEALWGTIGYSFMYLSNVQRPVIGSTDFTLHGITIGCEKRF